MTALRLEATADELPLFVAETEEMLQLLEEQIVRLEQDGPRPELVQEVFRAAHTIKGSSAAIGHLRMAKLTHAMETLLDRVRNGQLALTQAHTEHLFQALDVLRTLATEVQTLRVMDLDVDGLAEQIEALAQDPEAAGPATLAGPDPPLAPVMEMVRPSGISPPDGATHHLVIKLEAPEWGAVRAFQALAALDEIGTVLASRPSRDEIMRQQVRERLETFIQTSRGVEAIRAALDAVPETRLLSLTDASVASPPPRPAGGRPANATVRVEVAHLDRLLELVGELAIERTRLFGLCRGLQDELGANALLSEFAETTVHVGRVTDEMQTEVMKSRMLPIGTVFSTFPRTVRDLATYQRKKVVLDLHGQDTELDRSLVKEVGDLLAAVVRNAVSHGVESPAEREAAGKSVTAVLRLAASHTDGSILICVEDDGRGTLSAFAQGLVEGSDGGNASAEDAPGLAAVRASLARLGGTIQVEAEPGEGCRVLLRLPMTLAIVQALLVGVGESVFALPLPSVTEALRVPAAEIQHLRRQEAILLRGRVLPLARLSRLFGCAPSAEDAAPTQNVLVVAVKVGERQVGLVVDRLFGEQDVVVKPLGELIGEVHGLSSAAILADGTVALIVNVPALLQRLAAGPVDIRKSAASLPRLA